MREILVNLRHDNIRIDNVLKDMFKNIPLNALYKAFRNKDIKVNGIRVKENYLVHQGDIIQVFIIDSILYGDNDKNNIVNFDTVFSIVYEDRNILIVNKRQGIPVHADRHQSNNTLIDFIHLYLSQKCELNMSSSFLPSLCHRLDRNTGGLVMIAKNKESLAMILDKLKNKDITKFYQCLVTGKMESDTGELIAYLLKDEFKSKVSITDKPISGGQKIITNYSVLSYSNDTDISKLEINLVTGRTHQIRAHLAFIGHPIIGDGKYGLNKINRTSGYKYQALWAYKIRFQFKKHGGILDYLNGKELSVVPEYY